MQIAGIVCEYNPFHNGHLYHIRQTKAAGATHIVCVMSGNFVQRGEPAIIGKRIRTQCAIDNGADLVVELPLPWACAGAETFARGSVGLIDAVGADIISFGSECGNIDLIKSCAAALENENVCSLIKQYVGKMSYPSAVRKAVLDIFGEECARVLDYPNDVLNVEYLKALNNIKSSITPFAVKRQELHDVSIQSAKSIRNLILNGLDYGAYMPTECAMQIENQVQQGFVPAALKFTERAMLMKIRSMSAGEIGNIADVNEGLENRIYACAKQAADIGQLCAAIKTKRYTMSKIRRIVLSCFLDITKQDSEGTPPYIRVLGANEKGRQILKEIKNNSDLPVLTKYSELEGMSENCKRIFNLEKTAGDIYALCTPTVRPCATDLTDKAYFI